MGKGGKQIAVQNIEGAARAAAARAVQPGKFQKTTRRFWRVYQVDEPEHPTSHGGDDRRRKQWPERAFFHGSVGLGTRGDADHEKCPKAQRHGNTDVSGDQPGDCHSLTLDRNTAFTDFV